MAILVNVKSYTIILIYISLMTNDAEYIFLSLLAIHKYFMLKFFIESMVYLIIIKS